MRVIVLFLLPVNYSPTPEIRISKSLQFAKSFLQQCCIYKNFGTFAPTILQPITKNRMATSYSKADYVGITGSVLCIIHCLVTPILLISSTLLSDHTVRIGFLSLDYVFIGINVVAVYFATRRATERYIKIGLWGSLALFATALVLEDVHESFEYLAFAASAGLIGMHIQNLRTHKHDHSTH